MQRRAGDFFGHIVHRRQTADLEVVEARHPAGSRVPRHTHDRAYFCLNDEGAYIESYGRRVRRCQPGMLVFHPAGESHQQSHETPVTSVNVEVSTALMGLLFDCIGPLDQAVEFRAEGIVAAGVQLVRQFREADSDSVLAIEGLSWEILGAAARRPERAATLRAPRWLRDARDMLNQRFREAINLPSLAREAGVHPVHFAATFRKFVGCSIGEYRRRLRLEYVRQRLREPDLPLAHLAFDAGFADQSHLTREFKRFAGMTPSAYRASLRLKSG